MHPRTFPSLSVAAALLVLSGCASSRQAEDKHFDTCLGYATGEYLTVHLLDRGEPDIAHQIATSHLAEALSELQKIQRTAEPEQKWQSQNIAHLILKNAAEHRKQLADDKFSLQMLSQCRPLLTSKQDIERATELIDYLSQSCTNQCPVQHEP